MTTDRDDLLDKYRDEIARLSISVALLKGVCASWPKKRNDLLENAARIVDPAPNAKGGLWANNLRRKAAAIRAMKE